MSNGSTTGLTPGRRPRASQYRDVLDIVDRPDHELHHNTFLNRARSQPSRKERYLFPGWIPTEATDGPTRPMPPDLRRACRFLCDVLRQKTEWGSDPAGFLDPNNLILKTYAPPGEDGEPEPSAAFSPHADPKELWGHDLLLYTVSGLAILGTDLPSPTAPYQVFACPANSAVILSPELNHWVFPPHQIRPDQSIAPRVLATLSFNNTLEEMALPPLGEPFPYQDWKQQALKPA